MDKKQIIQFIRKRLQYQIDRAAICSGKDDEYGYKVAHRKRDELELILEEIDEDYKSDFDTVMGWIF